MSPTKRLKCHSEPKRSGGEESKILRRYAPQDNSIIELVAGSDKVSSKYPGENNTQLNPTGCFGNHQPVIPIRIKSRVKVIP